METFGNEFLLAAISKAKESILNGGFPAGAVIVKNNVIVGEGISIGNKLNDPTSHGEMAAIRDACKMLKTSDLKDATLYASMEPCAMCLSAAMWSSISRVVFACSKGKVSEAYYGGKYESTFLNTQFTRPLLLCHHTELEDKSLEVVQEWEATFSA